MMMIVPVYDLSYAEKVIAEAKKHPIAAILNVDDGPGRKLDKAWKTVSERLRNTGSEIYGYIDLKDKHSQIKPVTDINFDAVVWAQRYNATRYFYDNWGIETVKPPITKNCIANPGYDLRTTMPATVIHERNNWIAAAQRIEIKADGSIYMRSLGNRAVIAMNEHDLHKSIDWAAKLKMRYYYATERPDNLNAYDVLPSYFSEMNRYLATK